MIPIIGVNHYPKYGEFDNEEDEDNGEERKAGEERMGLSQDLLEVI